MEKSEFEVLFKALVEDKLAESKFMPHGKSLYFDDDKHNISLIRLGGRMSQPGAISHILCCRHSYLPNVEEAIPSAFESSVFSYPIKLKPLDIKCGFFGLRIKYTPQNLNYDFEVFSFADKSNDDIVNYLEKLVESVQFVKNWFEKSSASKLAKQIRLNGSQAWIEQLWLKAYEKHAI